MKRKITLKLAKNYCYTLNKSVNPVRNSSTTSWGRQVAQKLMSPVNTLIWTGEDSYLYRKAVLVAVKTARLRFSHQQTAGSKGV